MKNKKRFIMLVVLYIIGYLYFCIYGGINDGMKVSDSVLLRRAVISFNMPYGVRNLSINMFVWIAVSFFLIAFILNQTELKGPRANRIFLICYGIHMIITCLSRGIVEWIAGEDGLSTTLTILIVLMILVGGSVGITYLVFKKKGWLNSYQAYSDIMTEEEFERWQKKRSK